MKKIINCNVNNKDYEVSVDVGETLLEMLRDKIGLTGTKEGCSVGECGACTVIVENRTVDACIYLAVWADGRRITTIEGITKDDGTLTDIQQSFVDAGAVQCGYCTPGLVISSTVLLEENKAPTREEIRRGLSGNLCRCTGYQKIINAVENTVEIRNKRA